MEHQVPVPGKDQTLPHQDLLEPLDHLDRLTRRRMEIETLIYRLQYQQTIIHETYDRLRNTIHAARVIEREIHSIATDLNRNCTELQQTLVDGTLEQGICEEDRILKFLNDQNLLWEMPVEFAFKPLEVEVSKSDEFMLHHQIYFRLKEIHRRLTVMYNTMGAEMDFKAMVEFIYHDLFMMNSLYDELIERVVHAKQVLNGTTEMRIF